MATDQPTNDETIDAPAAAEILGVPEDRIQVMVDDGLLTPVEGSDGRFRAAEVEAVRLQGG